MSRTLLHNWEGSIEKNINNTEELLKIAEDIYNTAYARGKASEERPHGKWELIQGSSVVHSCSCCNIRIIAMIPYNFCPDCGADMRG